MNNSNSNSSSSSVASNICDDQTNTGSGARRRRVSKSKSSNGGIVKSKKMGPRSGVGKVDKSTNTGGSGNGKTIYYLTEIIVPPGNSISIAPQKGDHKRFKSQSPKQASLKASKSAYKILYEHLYSKKLDFLRDQNETLTPLSPDYYEFIFKLLNSKLNKVYIYRAQINKIVPSENYIKKIGTDYPYILNVKTFEIFEQN